MTYDLAEYQSKNELDHYLADRDSILLGARTMSPRRYYGLSVSDKKGNSLKIGIVSSDQGIRPSWTPSQDSAVLVVGHDLSLSFIDMARRTITKELQLGAVFYEFVKQPHPTSLIVMHELGVAKFDFSGREIWSVSTPDIAQSAELENGKTLVVQHHGPGRAMAIDISTGQVHPQAGSIKGDVK